MSQQENRRLPRNLSEQTVSWVINLMSDDKIFWWLTEVHVVEQYPQWVKCGDWLCCVTGCEWQWYVTCPRWRSDLSWTDRAPQRCSTKCPTASPTPPSLPAPSPSAAGACSPPAPHPSTAPSNHRCVCVCTCVRKNACECFVFPSEQYIYSNNHKPPCSSYWELLLKFTSAYRSISLFRISVSHLSLLSTCMFSSSLPPSVCLSLPSICPFLSLLQMAHLVPVKTHSSSMSGSQSLQDQTGSALSEGVSAGSPRPEMPRQNSDPTSDTPGPPMRIAGREERDRERERDRDRDRTAWLREEDIPPKVRESQSWRKTSTNDVCCSEFCVHRWIFLIFFGL